MAFIDHYQMLGLQRSVSDDQIKKARNRLANTFHPDKARGANQRLLFHQKMVEINAAYEVLGNPTRRKTYDREYDQHFRPADPLPRASSFAPQRPPDREYSRPPASSSAPPASPVHPAEPASRGKEQTTIRRLRLILFLSYSFVSPYLITTIIMGLTPSSSFSPNLLEIFLALIGSVLVIIAWIGTILKAWQRRQRRWVIALILVGGLALPLYLLFNPHK